MLLIAAWISGSVYACADGRADAEAARLARWAIANLEGALLLARASRDAAIITEAAEITARMLDEGSARHDR